MAAEEHRATTVPTTGRLEGWTVLHGPRVAELPGAAAECIVVGPGGIVVVGGATARGPRAAHRTEAVKAGVAGAGAVITSLLPAHLRSVVTTVVCVPDERSPHQPYPLIGGARGVAVVGTRALPGILHALPARLSADDVSAVTDALVHALVARPDGPLFSTADLPRSLRRRRAWTRHDRDVDLPRAESSLTMRVVAGVAVLATTALTVLGLVVGYDDAGPTTTPGSVTVEQADGGDQPS